jgi:hypothetical protein
MVESNRLDQPVESGLRRMGSRHLALVAYVLDEPLRGKDLSQPVAVDQLPHIAADRRELQTLCSDRQEERYVLL